MQLWAFSRRRTLLPLSGRSVPFGPFSREKSSVSTTSVPCFGLDMSVLLWG